MNILSLLNSAPMYAICGGIIAFVAVVCAVFMFAPTAPDLPWASTALS